MEKNRCRETKGVDPIHDAAMAGDHAPIVLHSAVTLDGGHDQSAAKSH